MTALEILRLAIVALSADELDEWLAQTAPTEEREPEGEAQ